MNKLKVLYELVSGGVRSNRSSVYKLTRTEGQLQLFKMAGVILFLWFSALPIEVKSLTLHEGLTQVVQAELDHHIERTRSLGEERTGITVAVSLPDGELLSWASGKANHEKNIPMTVNTRMPVGSIGKTWTASVVLSLVHDGVLDLDEPIRRWLGMEPWFKKLPNRDTLTLRQLLNHSGGLIDHVFESNDFIDWFKESVVSVESSRQNFAAIDVIDRTFDHRDLIHFALNKEPLFPSGQAFHYTDTGYILVGLIIEQASAKSYYQLLKNRFLDPLDLSMTSAMDNRYMPGVAQGYCVKSRDLLGLPEKILRNERLLFNPLIEWTGGGVVSNSQDLVRWVKALFTRVALASNAVEEMLKSVVDQGMGKDELGRLLGYGLGVSIIQTERGTAYRHGGFFPGYLSMVTYYPDDDVAIAMQINSDGADLEAQFNDIQDLVFDVIR